MRCTVTAPPELPIELPVISPLPTPVRLNSKSLTRASVAPTTSLSLIPTYTTHSPLPSPCTLVGSTGKAFRPPETTLAITSCSVVGSTGKKFQPPAIASSHCAVNDSVTTCTTSNNVLSVSSTVNYSESSKSSTVFFPHESSHNETVMEAAMEEIVSGSPVPNKEPFPVVMANYSSTRPRTTHTASLANPSYVLGLRPITSQPSMATCSTTLNSTGSTPVTAPNVLGRGDDGPVLHFSSESSHPPKRSVQPIGCTSRWKSSKKPHNAKWKRSGKVTLKTYKTTSSQTLVTGNDLDETSRNVIAGTGRDKSNGGMVDNGRKNRWTPSMSTPEAIMKIESLETNDNVNSAIYTFLNETNAQATMNSGVENMRTLLLNLNKSCDTCVTKMVVQLNDVDCVTPAVEGETLTLRIPTTAVSPCETIHGAVNEVEERINESYESEITVDALSNCSADHDDVCSRENGLPLNPVEENVGTNEGSTSLAITDVLAVEMRDVKPLVRPLNNLDDETGTGPESGDSIEHSGIPEHIKVIPKVEPIFDMTVAKEDTIVCTGNGQKKTSGANMDNLALKNFDDSHSNSLPEENQCVDGEDDDSGEIDVGGGEDGNSGVECSGAIIEGTSSSIASEEYEDIVIKSAKSEIGSESGGFWKWMTHRIKDV